MNKKEAIIPISYFSPISHIVIMHQYDTKIELKENYQKRSFRNKCRILGANGILDLSIPLLKGKTNSRIEDVGISYSQDWISNHLASIRSGYGTSPYFEFYYYKIENILKHRYPYLLDLSLATFEFLVEAKIISDFNFTKVYQKILTNENLDLRNNIHDNVFNIPSYSQVFEDKFGFVSDLSILDLLFNLGPESLHIINTSTVNSITRE